MLLTTNARFLQFQQLMECTKGSAHTGWLGVSMHALLLWPSNHIYAAAALS